RGRHYRMEAHVMVQRDRVDVRPRLLGREQRRKRRCEPQPAAHVTLIERLDAEAVACDECPAGATLQNDEREHAVEPLDAALAPPRIRLEDHLSIAPRPEAMTEVLELAPERFEVVDTTVENDRKTVVLVDHRLRGARPEIEYLEPPVAEGDGTLAEEALAVRSAGGLTIDHSPDGRRIGRPAIEANLCCNSTHIKTLPGIFKMTSASRAGAF